MAMIQWADERFAYRLAQGPAPKKARFGRAHAKAEREGWFRHLLSWGVGCILLGLNRG
ncbi:hypothetical protein [Fictibacillus terranigra]|uniref:Uncharacterized protein n=1 Tax=Fictibacillus terranigra TaxID=3058424 RepID=A0ABT8E0V0_9BACL|nr:hypothetical protein [Fictibacillus sp. CENA-BCM004]MDN4071528.1 hypothetical protein [Fictibacillus sp. CENA-BCM004]